MYGITTAAQLAGMSVQALRLYERKRLLEPDRTQGGTRRYSDADITRLRRISELIADGINLTGIGRVLGLEADNAGLHADNTDLRTRNAGNMLFIELHLELDSDLTLAQAHDITDEVERQLMAAFPLSEVLVHQEPYGLTDERLDTRIAEAGRIRRGRDQVGSDTGG